MRNGLTLALAMEMRDPTNPTLTSSTPIKSGLDEQEASPAPKPSEQPPEPTSPKQGLLAGKGEKQLRKLLRRLFPGSVPKPMEASNLKGDK